MYARHFQGVVLISGLRGSLWFHARRAWQSTVVSGYQCIDALLNSTGSDKGMPCGHRSLSHQLRRKTSRFMNTLKARLCMKKHSCRQELLGVLWSSARWALSRCKEWTEEFCFEFYITLLGGHWDSVQTGTRRELCWVLYLEEESTEGSSQGYWTPWKSQQEVAWVKDSQEGISNSPFGGERKKGRVSLEVEAIGKLRTERTFVCMWRLCRSAEVRILWGFEKRRSGGTTLLRVQART